MVAYIRKNPQEYAVGGIVKKLAPKVIGKLREFAPKIEGPKTPKQSFTAFDEAGLPIKDFDNFKDAQKFVEKEPAYSVGNTPKPEVDDTAGAMFWPSREKLIAFHVKHTKNTFILVACTLARGLVRLYPGSKILELVHSGLKLEPLALGWDACRLQLESL